MNLNILDIIIVVLLLLGFLAGFKRGIIKQGVLTAGIILVIVLAFIFKNPLSITLYKHCPFFTIGILKNYSALNILLYELLSFCILLMIFSLILSIIIKISGVVERIVRATVILALPSRILGAILGVLEFYIFIFIILLIITMPIFTVSESELVRESKLKDKILNNTLLISKLSERTINSVNDINSLISSKNDESNVLNCKALNILVKNKVVSEDSIKYLKDNNKIDNSCKIEKPIK